MNCYYVYLIKSLRKNWFYVGFTSDVNKRMQEHSLGRVRSTKFYKPFDLVFVQVLENSSDARNFEKFIKIRFNKEALLDLILPRWRNR